MGLHFHLFKQNGFISLSLSFLQFSIGLNSSFQIVKGIVHPIMKMLSSFTRHHVNPNKIVSFFFKWSLKLFGNSILQNILFAVLLEKRVGMTRVNTQNFNFR